MKVYIMQSQVLNCWFTLWPEDLSVIETFGTPAVISPWSLEVDGLEVSQRLEEQHTDKNIEFILID